MGASDGQTGSTAGAAGTVAAGGEPVPPVLSEETARYCLHACGQEVSVCRVCVGGDGRGGMWDFVIDEWAEGRSIDRSTSVGGRGG
jgi:hypothetical protein